MKTNEQLDINKDRRIKDLMLGYKRNLTENYTYYKSYLTDMYDNADIDYATKEQYLNEYLLEIKENLIEIIEDLEKKV